MLGLPEESEIAHLREFLLEGHRAGAGVTAHTRILSTQEAEQQASLGYIVSSSILALNR